MTEETNEKSFITKFIEKFKPGTDMVLPDEETLKRAEASVLPPELINLWKNYGFGNYGNGLIKVINPFEYTKSLYLWLGGEDSQKLPILMTGFGDIFYYRKITDTDADISLLDIHYRRIDVCEYSFEEFIEDYILDKDIIESELREPLFQEAFNKLGELKQNEIFLFTPALALGGGEELKYIKKGDAITHHHLLFGLN